MLREYRPGLLLKKLKCFRFLTERKNMSEKAAYWGCLWHNFHQILLYGVRSRYWKDKKLIRNFIRKTTKQRLQLVWPRSRWDGHLQINFRWIRHEVQNWICRLKAEYTGGLLRNTGCHKGWGNSWLAERMSVHQAGCIHSVISPSHFIWQQKRFIIFGLRLEKFLVAINWALQSTCGTLQIDWGVNWVGDDVTLSLGFDIYMRFCLYCGSRRLETTVMTVSVCWKRMQEVCYVKDLEEYSVSVFMIEKLEL